MSLKKSATGRKVLFRYVIGGLAVILIATLILIFNGGIQVGTANHAGLLPVVRRILDPDYLPADFGIHLRYYHHRPFAFLVAAFAGPLGEDSSLVLIRVLGTLLLSASMYWLCKTIHLSTLAFLALGVMVAANTALTGMGLETNTFIGNREAMPTTYAHAFVLLGIASLIRQEFGWAAFFAGLTFLFHLQIGFAFVLILLPFYLARLTRFGFKRALQYIGLFLLPASWSIWELSQMVNRGLVSLPFSMRDVRFRQPAHFVLKSTENSIWVVAHFALLVAVCLWLRKRDGDARKTSNVLLLVNCLVATLSLLHLIDFYYFQSGSIIKFQFLRMSVFLTFFGSLALILVINKWFENRPRHYQSMANLIVVVVSLLLYFIPTTRQATAPSLEVKKYREQTSDWVAACLWIGKNTISSALFLTPPGNEGFTYLSDRSTVVEFKINPDGPQFLSEWYERLTDLVGGVLPNEEGFANAPLLNRAYAELTPEEILRLKTKYGAGYAVLIKPSTTEFESLYENQQYKVVRLPDSER